MNNSDVRLIETQWTRTRNIIKPGIGVAGCQGSANAQAAKRDLKVDVSPAITELDKLDVAFDASIVDLFNQLGLDLQKRNVPRSAGLEL